MLIKRRRIWEKRKRFIGKKITFFMPIANDSDAEILRRARELGVPLDPEGLGRYAAERGVGSGQPVSYAPPVRFAVLREVVLREYEARGIQTGSSPQQRAETEDRRSLETFQRAERFKRAEQERESQAQEQRKQEESQRVIEAERRAIAAGAVRRDVRQKEDGSYELQFFTAQQASPYGDYSPVYTRPTREEQIYFNYQSKTGERFRVEYDTPSETTTTTRTGRDLVELGQIERGVEQLAYEPTTIKYGRTGNPLVDSVIGVQESVANTQVRFGKGILLGATYVGSSGLRIAKETQDILLLTPQPYKQERLTAFGATVATGVVAGIVSLPSRSIENARRGDVVALGANTVEAALLIEPLVKAPKAINSGILRLGRETRSTFEIRLPEAAQTATRLGKEAYLDVFGGRPILEVKQGPMVFTGKSTPIGVFETFGQAERRLYPEAFPQPRQTPKPIASDAPTIVRQEPFMQREQRLRFDAEIERGLMERASERSSVARQEERIQLSRQFEDTFGDLGRNIRANQILRERGYSTEEMLAFPRQTPPVERTKNILSRTFPSRSRGQLGGISSRQELLTIQRPQIESIRLLDERQSNPKRVRYEAEDALKSTGFFASSARLTLLGGQEERRRREAQLIGSVSARSYRDLLDEEFLRGSSTKTASDTAVKSATRTLSRTRTDTLTRQDFPPNEPTIPRDYFEFKRFEEPPVKPPAVPKQDEYVFKIPKQELKVRNIKRGFRYQPDILSGIFGIYGRQPSDKKVFTGVELRPLSDGIRRATRRRKPNGLEGFGNLVL